MITKNNLKDKLIVKSRGGTEYEVNIDKQVLYNEDGGWLYFSDYNDNMECDGSSMCDIVEIIDKSIDPVKVSTITINGNVSAFDINDAVTYVNSKVSKMDVGNIKEIHIVNTNDTNLKKDYEFNIIIKETP
jgi:hypothetical protein